MKRLRLALRSWAFAVLALGAIEAGAQAPKAAPAKPAGCEFGADNRDATIAACTKLIDGKGLRGDKLAEAYSARAEAWYTKKDFDRAVADMDAAIKARPGNANDLVNRGIYRGERGDRDGAIADYTAALHISPDAGTYSNRGYALMDKGDFATALADFDEAIQFDQSDPGYYVGRGRAYRGIGKYYDAMRDANTAANAKPPAPEAVCDRGLAYFLDGEFGDAAKDLDQCGKDNNYAYMRLWRYIAQARSAGDGSEIRRELDAKGIMGREWPGPVRSMLLGRVTPEALIAAAADPDAKKAQAQDCEVRFYIGEFHLIRGEKPKAQQRFTEALKACLPVYLEYQGAQAELKRLAKK